MQNSAKRFYRRFTVGSRYHSFHVNVRETDLWIAVPQSNYSESLPAHVEKLVWRQRRQLEDWLRRHPQMTASLEPCFLEEPAPEIVMSIVRAANCAGVGPMAAVAGQFAELVGSFLLNYAPEVIVENGGDIFLKAVEPISVGVFAGNSPLSGKISLYVEPAQTPLGICTSSGTVGPSFSRGRADAAVALSPSAPLADAAATAMGNLVYDPPDLEKAVELARSIEGISGALVICHDRLAAWGALQLRPGNIPGGRFF